MGPSATRHELGQWFTPPQVARLALALASPEAAPTTLLDPSCGDGAFLRASVKLWGHETARHGVDIDARALEEARAGAEGAQLHHADFFDWAPHHFDGYELLAGNPPYVRQERLERDVKQRVSETLSRAWPQLPEAEREALVGRGDLAAPFVLVAMRCLAPGHRASFVLSQAFLDSDYGRRFWRLLEAVAEVELILDAPEERWFSDAAVHTMVVVLRRRREGDAEGSTPTVLCLEGACERAADRIESGADWTALGRARKASRDAGTWAAALRAPQSWFDWLAAATDSLVPLEELGALRRGLTTGANELFYLTTSEAAEHGIPERLLQPLLRVPGSQACIEQGAGTERVLALPKEPAPESLPGVASYLAGHLGAADRSTLKARKPWWHLRLRPARVFLTKAYAERFLQPYAPEPMVADQRLYSIEPTAGVDPELLSAVLNSSLTSLAIESLGRASMGQGALEWGVADAKLLPLLDPRMLAAPDEVRAAFRALRARPVERLEQELQREDRIALDRALTSGMPEAQALLPRLHRELVASNRARKLRSEL